MMMAATSQLSFAWIADANPHVLLSQLLQAIQQQHQCTPSKEDKEKLATS
jgi:hypothetical protein